MTAFPFSAIVGQDDLREALLACAVDPAIGGVLVRGERGTAKTTTVRGLAPLVGALVELPIGATADRVLGTLDLERALAEGAAAFKPGLLAAADGGVLYVDEVNLLPDHLVDVLLDAAALGRVHVERDGLSAAYDARFLLVGTMNPEEGDLRPQLLDRFGLSVEVVGSLDPPVRVEIVRRRLAFDRDPAGFAASWAGEEAAVASRVAAARERLSSVRLPDRIVLLIAGTCARLGVDGHRADIVCARAATALAALDGASEVTRRPRPPRRPPGALAPPPPRPVAAAGPRRVRAGRCHGRGRRRRLRPGPDPERQRPARRRTNPRRPSRSPSLEERPYRADAPSRERTDAPAEAGRAPLLSLAGRGRGDAGRRSRAEGGPPIDSREPAGTVTDLAVAATLRAASAAAPSPLGARCFPPTCASTCGPARRGTSSCSASMPPGRWARGGGWRGSRARCSSLLTDAYQRRDRVALVTFRGDGAQLVLPPTSSVERAAAVLDESPHGRSHAARAGARRSRAGDPPRGAARPVTPRAGADRHRRSHHRARRGRTTPPRGSRTPPPESSSSTASRGPCV